MVRNPLHRLIPSLVVFMLLLPLCAGAEAPPTAGSEKVAEKSHVTESAARKADRERNQRQIKRILLRSLEDLQVERKFALDDIRELEQRVAAVTPLESPRRINDFQALLDWYNGYLDRLGEREGECERGLAALAAAADAGGELWGKSLEEMAQEENARTQELDEEAKSVDAEGKRLSGIYDRKRILQGRFFDLDNRIALIGRRLNDNQRSPSDKQKDRQEADRLRTESGLAQAEFNALPAVDDDILRHYAEMGARRRWASDQVALKTEEYQAVRTLIAALNQGVPGDDAAVAKAYRRVIEIYESGSVRMEKMIDELDLNLSRIPPAESVRQTGQSSELAALYQRLRERSVERNNRYKALKGAYEADLGELNPERQ
jgi:predicted nucleotidyltransferase